MFQIQRILLPASLAKRLRLISLLCLALSVPTFPWGTKWQEDRERKQSNGDSLCALGISVPPIRAEVLPSKLLLSFPVLPNYLGVGQERTERKPTKLRDFLYSLWLLGAPFPASWTKNRVFSSSSFSARGAQFWVWVALKSRPRDTRRRKKKRSAGFMIYWVLVFSWLQWDRQGGVDLFHLNGNQKLWLFNKHMLREDQGWQVINPERSSDWTVLTGELQGPFWKRHP